MNKRIIKVSLISVVSTILAVALIAGSYVIYVSAQYYRIEDMMELETHNNMSDVISINGEFTVITYNIGFGAYNHDFSFFMDSGVMLDGKTVNGNMSKAASRQVVLDNTTGAINSVKGYNADFLLFQEVDTSSTRSHKVNQKSRLQELGNHYSQTHAVNFHSAYLFYPFNDPHGKVNSGITTMSRYNINQSVRRSFPVDISFPAKFFDLDRCFSIHRMPLDSGSEFVLINIHMSAYDEGGLVRASQLAMLNAVLEEEYLKGNYIVAGGDFNHDIADSLNLFATTQQVPEWVYVLTDDDLPNGFSFAAPNNAPTCRSTDLPYVKGINYSVIIDGFIVSDNISVIEVETIDNDFMYSDHNPVMLNFSFVTG